MKNFYITTPIYYVNDSPHIGHAYTTLACDVMARFKRLDGYKVKFLTGTDEHGQKVAKTAENLGKSPKEFCDEVSERFRNLAKTMNFSNDDFIRTTDERHKNAAIEIWNRLIKNGHIYISKYAGWYCVRDEAFYTESELVDGKAPTGAEVSWVEEPSYFFDLSKWQDKLLELYENNPDFILPKSRRNEITSFVKGGLNDLSVSRTSFSWGIPVPNDEKHVMYVWLDALTNYLSAVGFPDENAQEFKDFWPADIHVVGKDIIRFHTVYWPAFLMAAGLPVPKRVYAHGWWTNEGQKISKSLGNAIDPLKLIDEFGLDQTRYYLMREIPFGNDGNFSRESFINRINSELANNIGNLSQRTLSMINKNCDGKVPECHLEYIKECRHLAQAYGLADILRKHIDAQEFNDALEAIVQLATAGNIYIDEQAPWALKKENPTKMAHVLYVLAETIRIIALSLLPFMPDSASKILAQLEVPESERTLDRANIDSRLKSGTILPAPAGVFPRYQPKSEAIKNAS